MMEKKYKLPEKTGVEIKENCYRSRFTFYGDVLQFEYSMTDHDAPNQRHAAVRFFLQDGSDDAQVSVSASHRNNDKCYWISDFEILGYRVPAGSVSAFVTACRELITSWFNNYVSNGGGYDAA